MTWLSNGKAEGSGGNATNGDRTNLGTLGNEEVAQTFQRYVSKHPLGACVPTTSGVRRVLVTGFGLFHGVPYNISGTVVRSMADEKFWPSEWKSGMAEPTSPPSPGILHPEDQGGWAKTRRLRIQNVDVDVCFLLLDVKWDLAAAIILHEVSRFQPETVVMSGRGGSEVSIEWGAINQASLAPGFDSHGNPLPVNTPVEPWILANHPVDASLQMSWDGHSIGATIRKPVKALGYGVKVQTEARTDNTYICNNVSFAVLNGLAGQQTTLAGDLLKVQPPQVPVRSVGFFHYPHVDTTHPNLGLYTNGVYKWGEVIGRLILK